MTGAVAALPTLATHPHQNEPRLRQPHTSMRITTRNTTLLLLFQTAGIVGVGWSLSKWMDAPSWSAGANVVLYSVLYGTGSWFYVLLRSADE